MTDKLVQTADAATPFDYAALPGTVKVILGYIGQAGATPYVWSTADAAKAKAAVGAWAPIWTPPQHDLSVDAGHRAAAGAIAALSQYDYPKGGPVFVDVERGTYDANPEQADGFIEAFQASMGLAGYGLAYPYAPEDYGRGWVAHWVPKMPTSLPPAYVGQQWKGNAFNGMCDLSVFRPAVFAALITTTEDDTVALTKDDKAWIVKQLATMRGDIIDHVDALHNGKAGKLNWPSNVAAVHEDTGAILKALSVTGLAPADIDAIAAAVAAKVGDTDAGLFLDEMSKRLKA